MNLCVINVADGAYVKGQDRLRRSIEDVGHKGDLMFFDHFLPDWPTHQKVTWGFKVYAFEEAYKKGYDAALWIDAAGIVVRPLDKIIKTMEKDGVFAFSRFNVSVGEWSADKTLEAFGLTREKAFRIPELVTVCLGINFKHEKGLKFYKEFKKRVNDGISFLGLPNPPYTTKDVMTNDSGLISPDPRVKGHRGDQTVASLMVNQMHIRPTKRICFDIVGEAKKGQPYSNYIPVDTVVVQNRDVKTDNYLLDLRSYMEPWRNRNILHMCKTAYKSVIRYTKDFIKWHLVYKKKYDL